MKRGAVIRVGLIFAAAIIVTFWGINYLKGRNFLKQEKAFYAQYERIGNLTKSSPVTIRGFQVGQVRDIVLSDSGDKKILVKIIITYRNLDLPKTTIARIASMDLMGTKAISLLLGKDSLFHAYGDTLPGEIEGDLRDQVNTQMIPLKLKAEDLMSSMDSVLVSFQMIMNENTRQALSESFSSINNTLNSLEKTSLFVDGYVKNEAVKISFLLNTIDSISLSLQGQVVDLREFMGNLRNISDTLSNVPIIQAVTSFNLVLADLHELFSNLNNGEGSLGRLLDSDSLYDALLASGENLNRLIEDIRIDPKRYVHFSLIDRGKSVYTTDDSDLVRILTEKGIENLYVCLLESPTPLAPDHADLKGLPRVDYLQAGAYYYYYVFRNRNLDRCIHKMNQYRKQYPFTGIYTWINGQWTRLNF